MITLDPDIMQELLAGLTTMLQLTDPSEEDAPVCHSLLMILMKIADMQESCQVSRL